VDLSELVSASLVGSLVHHGSSFVCAVAFV
jgi:hypothetical protein